MTTTHQPADLPPFAVLPDEERPADVEEETDGRPSWRRRWSTGHTVAAAVVAGGVLLSGGAALAARDSSADAPGFSQVPGEGQLPGPGQLPSQPGQGGFVPGQPPQGGGSGQQPALPPGTTTGSSSAAVPT